jgi:hypothetical protein
MNVLKPIAAMILDAGCSILDAGYSILDNGYLNIAEQGFNTHEGSGVTINFR